MEHRGQGEQGDCAARRRCGAGAWAERGGSNIICIHTQRVWFCLLYVYTRSEVNYARSGYALTAWISLNGQRIGG